MSTSINCLKFAGEATVTPSGRNSDALEFLGGLSAQAVNKVGAGAAGAGGSQLYASLPRPAKLPHFAPKNVKDKSARAAYLKIWDGNFQAKWLFSKDHLAVVASPTGLSGDNQFQGKPLVSVTVKKAENDPMSGDLLSACGSSIVEPNFRAALKEDRQDELAYRMLHQFLRSCGTFLMSNAAGARVVLSGMAMLLKKYKDPALMLDIALVNCDLFINHNVHVNPLDIGMAQSKVAEILETKGDFGAAATLYHHIGETSLVPSFSIEGHAKMLDFEALALKRDGQLDKAEHAYIRALHCRRLSSAAASAWNLNEPLTHNLLSNMLIFYFEMLHQMGGERLSLRTANSDIVPTFCALLFAAGFQAGQGGPIQFMIHNIGLKKVSLLKPQVRTPSGALETLVVATAQPDKAHFYSALAACVPDNTTFMMARNHDHCIDTAAQRRFDMNSARGTATKGDHALTEFYFCGYSDCKSMHQSPAALYRCPCKSISYCSKDCQVKDWPAHKKGCVWNKARKKKEGK